MRCCYRYRLKIVKFHKNFSCALYESDAWWMNQVWNRKKVSNFTLKSENLNSILSSLLTGHEDTSIRTGFLNMIPRCFRPFQHSNTNTRRFSQKNFSTRNLLDSATAIATGDWSPKRLSKRARNKSQNVRLWCGCRLFWLSFCGHFLAQLDKPKRA